MSTVDSLARVDRMAFSTASEASGLRHDRDAQGEMPVVGPSEIAEQRARALAAKLSLPHMGFILSRPRLQALTDPARGGGVVSLVAGPGYGKTAFIVDLLSSAGGRTTYFSLDEGDRDPLRFLTYLMAGLGMESSSATKSEFGWSTLDDGDGAVLDATATLVDFISGLAGQATTIAIDDLHVVDSSPGVVTALDLIIRGLPPGWTLVLSSRRSLPLRLNGVNLGGRVAHLQGRDLRLTPSEVGAWAWQNWTVRLQPSEARALWKLTQGWPAALVLLGHRLLADSGDIRRRDIASVIAKGRDLRTYLERDILAGLEPAVAETMLAAALLPRVMFPRDDAVLPGAPGAAEAILRDLVARGYLVTSAGPRSYTVHPLLRAFSERRAQQIGESTELVERVAAHLDRNGEYHHSARLYLRVGRLGEVERPLRSLLLSSAGTSVALSREDWVESVSGVGDRTDLPWLLVAHGHILRQQARYAEAAALFERAARSLSASGDKEGLLHVLMSAAFCLGNQGLWGSTLDVLKRCGSLARSVQEKAEVLVSEGGVLVSLCRWDEAVENWERALALAPQETRAVLTQRVHVHRGRLFYSLGQYGLSRRWFEKAVTETAGLRTLTHAASLHGLSTTACLMGDYERAERAAADCRRLIDSRGYEYLAAPCAWIQANTALGRWDYRGAVLKIKEAQLLAVEAGDVEGTFWTEDTLGDLCRRNSNPLRALEHHRLALEIVQKNRLGVSERVQAVAGEAIDLVLLGRDDEARPLLEDTVRTARRWSLSSSLTRALFYLGWLHACSGREADAARCLGEAMRIAEEHRHVHFFSQEARVAVPILALADRLGARSFVRGAVVPVLPERLREYFHQLAEGKVYPTDVALGPRRSKAVASPETRPVGQTQPVTLAREGMETLTDREREVLEMISIGMANKAIGSRLFITEKTVKTHANHIFHKLGVRSRLQATLVFQNYQRAAKQKPAGRQGRK
jgi:LuxR family maltose regulon positive regulatory protein